SCSSTRPASSASIVSPVTVSVPSPTSMRTPSARSSSWMCSSWLPRSARKCVGFPNVRVGEAAAGSATLLTRLDDRVRPLDGRIELARVLAAGLREVGPPAPAAADDRRELLDDVAGVVAPDEVLRDDGEE